MCGTCGCSPLAPPHRAAAAHEGPRLTIDLERELLGKNDRLAQRNRRWFTEHGILALNFIGAPGAGKTSLLEHTLWKLPDTIPVAVLEGDQETDRDAERIRATGAPVDQINTGTGCHLDAEMVFASVERLRPEAGSLLAIENVGNLVCPSLFDLGEAAKVVVMSVTEGEDKPIKYPHVFRAAAALVVTKLDLLPFLEFDLDRCLSCALSVNQHLRLFMVSATRGDGMDTWVQWVQRAREERGHLEPANAEVRP